MTNRLYTNVNGCEIRFAGSKHRLFSWATCAVLLQIKHDQTHIRGFSTDGSFEVFSMHVPHDDRAFTAAPVPSVIAGNRPSGYVLKFDAGIEVSTSFSDFDRPIDVLESDDIEAVWHELPRRVLRYSRGPNVVTPRWMSRDEAIATITSWAHR